MCRSRAATDGESAIDAGEAWGETLAAWLSLSLALLLRAGRPATGSQPPAAPLAIVGPRSQALSLDFIWKSTWQIHMAGWLVG